VPEGIARVIAKAMTRERADRFSTAREFLDALVSSAGGIISNRAGRTSGEDVVRSSNPILGKSPTPQANEFAPTLEVASGSHSKVGWSTSGGQAARRDRTLYAVVGGAALLIAAGAGAFMFSRTDSDAASLPDAEITLASNVEGARFLVDGALVPGGVLKGAKGARRTVRAEADGHQPVEAEITIDPSISPVKIAFAAPSPTAPVIDPGPPMPEATATASASTTPSTTPAAGRPPIGKGKAPVLTKDSPPTATGTPVVTPPPKSTGVAGGLKIKED
jgi:eukaryotic-like serine/threonine-protein kinase